MMCNGGNKWENMLRGEMAWWVGGRCWFFSGMERTSG